MFNTTRHDTNAAHGRSNGGRLRTWTCGALASAVLALAAAAPAHAWQQTNQAGSPGDVRNLATVYVGDVYDGSAGTKFFTVWAGNAPDVYRSPSATGAQHVLMVYAVERWNGSVWQVLQTSSVQRGDIAANQSGVRFAVAPNMRPAVSTGYFRLSYVVEWYDANWRLVARTNVVATAATDVVCGVVNPNRRCTTGPGWAYVG